MNFYAHLSVAMRLGHRPATGFGAMLPDLVRMAGVNMPGDLPEAVATGVWLHHRTDEAFHGHVAFVEGSRALRAELDRINELSAGAARAIAHVGWELLLDGVVAAGDPPTVWTAAWDAADRHGIDLAGLAGHLRDPSWPRRYGDPQWIAERLVRILAARPRLAFSPAQRAAVADALALTAASVASAAPRVMAEVIGGLGSLGNGPLRRL